ncbi:MAG: iron-sulfur cluster repair di-iron protein [Planctomycetes bacterium]|nr:iron-sulfur cluster repair di-iron protein [Planctomycetota bacterium]MCC7170937.1 iron-sulfur cluster repair di-iron protein [Planctomycetota bacterium]
MQHDATSTEISRTLKDLVLERSDRLTTLMQFGLDACCGGDRTLKDACASANVDPETVLAALRRAEVDAPINARFDAKAAATEALIAHILDQHHVFLRRELPRLELLARKVAQAHGARHPTMVEFDATFREFASELELHMQKEEMVLFPTVLALARGETPSHHCGVDGPVAVMRYEHERAGAAIHAFRRLTSGYSVPQDACTTWKALVEGLRALEADLLEHMHEENNVLFPRACALAAR